MSDTTMPWTDQIIGCIVGGAIGDALCGVPERGRISVSDDTQLTLATCQAIEAAGEVSPTVIAEHFADGFRQRKFTGIGASTLKALRDLEVGGHWALSGAKGERAAGNGAAMRIAPVAFVLDPLNTTHRVTIRDVCRITHHSDEAYCGALAVLIAIRLAATDVWHQSRDLLRQIAGPLPDSHVRDRLVVFSDLPDGMPLADIAARFGASGFVAETVPLGLMAASRMTAASIESIFADIAQIAGDSDTIGSIAGQIAGTNIGFSCLPTNLVVSIPQIGTIIDAATRFANEVANGDIRL